MVVEVLGDKLRRSWEFNVSRRAIKRNKDEARQPSLAVGGATAAGGVGLNALSVVSVSRQMGRGVKDRDAKLVDRLVRESPVPIKDNVYGAGPMFIQEGPAHPTPHIDVASKARLPGILGHEIGHAKIHKNRFGRMLQNPITGGMGALSQNPLISAAIGAVTGRSDNENVQRAGRWAPAILGAPRMAYEVGASVLGMRHLRRSGASRRQMIAALKPMVAGSASYAGGTAVGLGASFAGQALSKNASAYLSCFRELNKMAEINEGRLHPTPITKNVPSKVPNARYSVKEAFATSQWSGGQGYGGFRQASQIPAGGAAPVVTKMVGNKPMLGQRKVASTAITPKGRLASTQMIGKPKTTAPPGPSISQISKPIGFGRPLPGTTKR